MVRLAACFLLASAPSCPDLYALAAHGFTPPALDASRASATTQSVGLRVVVSLSAANPNPYPLSVSSVDYQMWIEGQPVFGGSQTDAEIPEHASRTIGLSGVIRLSSNMYRSLRPGQTAAYAIGGTAHVDSPAGIPVDVEFEGSGSFEVPSSLPEP